MTFSPCPDASKNHNSHAFGIVIRRKTMVAGITSTSNQDDGVSTHTSKMARPSFE
jgi:hypothetical protein